MSRPVERALDRVEGVERKGNGWMARCPAHDDDKPSLSISEGEDGRVLLTCHAGCDIASVIESIDLKMSDLFEDGNVQRKIVATYAYRNAEGTLLKEVIRDEPKGFRQRRPDGRGGRIWNTNGVEEVPYMLPELLAAMKRRPLWGPWKDGEPIFVVEGEKDVDGLFKVGLLATCNAGGAGKWTHEHAKYFDGRVMVIIPDNDAMGQTHAEKVAETLSGAKSVQMLNLPRLPPKGDVSDWLDAGGTKDELLRLAQKAPVWNSALLRLSKVSTVTREREELKVDAFPLDVFPPAIASFAQTAAKSMSCPVDYLGAAILSALATAIGSSRTVVVKQGWTEPPVFYLGIVGNPGDGKSPAIDAAIAPLRELEAGLATGSDHVGSQIVTTDATIEALIEILEKNPRGLLLAPDELRGWIDGIGQYKSGSGADRAHYLTLWSAKPLHVNRKKAASLRVPYPVLNIVGGIQPDLLPSLLDRQGRCDGMLERLLLIYPGRRPTGRFDREGISPAISANYASIIKWLWEGGEGETSQEVTFSTEAFQRFSESIDELRARRRELDQGLWAFLSKLEAYLARFSLVIHYALLACGAAKGTEIDKTSVDSARKLVDYFLSHARKVRGVLRREADQSRVGQAHRFIKLRGGRVTAREVLRSRVAGVRTANDVRLLFEDLAEELLGETRTGNRRDQIEFHLFSV